MRKVLIGAVILLTAGAGGLFWWLETEPDRVTLAQDVVLEVPHGASGGRLPRLFAAAGLVDGADVYAARLYVKVHGIQPKAGKHQLKQGMTLAQALTATTENPMPDDVPVTIVEGSRLADTDEFLASGNPPLIVRGAYTKAAGELSKFKIPFPVEGSNLEGYLYPDTYEMPSGHFETEKLIQRQLDSFADKFAIPYAQEIKKSGRSLRELVIVASLLEREEKKPENRPMIAGIIYKRLSRKIPLGVDATSRYTLKDWNDHVAFLGRLRDASDPYNSRLRAGLPPSPIGAPSVPSLLAALHPKDNPYLFYLHDKNGNVHFGKDAAEHEENRKKYDVY